MINLPPTSESDYPDDMKAPSYVVDGERYRSLLAERDGLREKVRNADAEWRSALSELDGVSTERDRLREAVELYHSTGDIEYDVAKAILVPDVAQEEER